MIDRWMAGGGGEDLTDSGAKGRYEMLRGMAEAEVTRKTNIPLAYGRRGGRSSFSLCYQSVFR
jgi:hypothetical protein